MEWLDEYSLGIATAFTLLAPRASTASAATTAESIPPDRPKITDLNLFLSTYERRPTTNACHNSASGSKGSAMLAALAWLDGVVEISRVSIAVAVGKDTHDKRAAIAERDSKREVSREIGRRNKGDI
jgi:hypothetical protein